MCVCMYVPVHCVYNVYYTCVGQKTLSEYMYYPNAAGNINEPGSSQSNVNRNAGEHHHPHHPHHPHHAANENAEHHGTVIVYDVVYKKPIAHFQAHQQPLSVMAFDPSGTLVFGYLDIWIYTYIHTLHTHIYTCIHAYLHS